MEKLENVIVAICVFGSGVWVIYIIAKYNYLLKKTMAEKGMAPQSMKVNYSEMACIVMGIGLGLGIASVFTVIQLSEDTMDLLVWASILMGGGVGLFAAHFIRQKNERGKQRQ